MIPFIQSEKSLSIYSNGNLLTFNLEKFDINVIMSLVISDDYEALENLNKPINTLKFLEIGNVVVYDDYVECNGVVLHDGIALRMIEYKNAGYDISYLAKFLDKLTSNPNYNTKQHLYRFLEKKNIPITEDGDFLAYKGVTINYKDCYTNKFDNYVGVIHEMPFKNVDDNPDALCSYGFHVGSLDYALRFGAKTMIAKVNPADVVSVTTDHDFQKMRVCKYEIVAEYEKPLDNNFEDINKISNWKIMNNIEELSKAKYLKHEGEKFVISHKSKTGKVRLKGLGGTWFDPLGKYWQ